MSTASKKRKKKIIVFALKKLFRLTAITVAIASAISLIIAAVCFISFIDTQKNEEYTVKLRTEPQTKAVTIKKSDNLQIDTDIVEQGYFPLSSLKGIVGLRVVGDSKGITISNTSGTEVMEITPNSNIIKVNGTWKKTDTVVLYKDGECYLPMDLVEKYTCLSVSYDEENLMYTVSSVGTTDISFFPQNNTEDALPKYNDLQND